MENETQNHPVSEMVLPDGNVFVCSFTVPQAWQLWETAATAAVVLLAASTGTRLTSVPEAIEACTRTAYDETMALLQKHGVDVSPLDEDDFADFQTPWLFCAGSVEGWLAWFRAEKYRQEHGLEPSERAA